MSDIHNEFSYFSMPQLPTDFETILVLAGDVGVWNDNYKRFIEQETSRFLHTIVIAGNHEFYHNDYMITMFEMEKWFSQFTNKTFLNGNSIEINGVLFVGGTLWTDFNGGDVNALITAQFKMNDFRLISHGDTNFTPEIAYQIHVNQIEKITDILDQRDLNVPTAVVTHHAPSFKSVQKKYAGDPINFAYASDKEALIEYFQPEIWIHGHVHSHHQYMVERTLIVANPRGYVHPIHGAEKTEFNPNLVLELSN